MLRQKKELANKDELIAKLNKQIKELQAEKVRLQEQHKSEIGKLRNGYQKEIDAAIRRAETAERQSKEKDTVIDRQRKQIGLLDRKVNPQRYSLSSGAKTCTYQCLKLSESVTPHLDSGRRGTFREH